MQAEKTLLSRLDDFTSIRYFILTARRVQAASALSMERTAHLHTSTPPQTAAAMADDIRMEIQKEVSVCSSYVYHVRSLPS